MGVVEGSGDALARTRAHSRALAPETEMNREKERRNNCREGKRSEKD